ncbi:MAG: hypothetical protein RR636_14000 [Clostridium sp.]|uniref:hypothetical protein n=1 Tax=Clostridium sp. TaxID=1506 RepID=UPI00304D7B3E
MSLFRQSMHICNENIRKWSSNYRIWVLFIMISIFIFDYTNEIVKFAYSVDYKVTPWMFSFLFTQSYMKRIIFMGVILLFCDAPFIDNTQQYVVVRSGRKSWNIGQISYIFLASFLYFLFMIAITIIFNLRYMEFNLEWGKVLGTLGLTSVGDMVSAKVWVSGKIISFYTPLQAMAISYILSSLVATLIGLLIYVINSFTNSQFLGILAGIVLVLVDTLTKFNHMLLWFSPVSWASLEKIGIEKTATMPPISYVFGALIIIISILISIAIIFSKKKPIEICNLK